MFLKLNATFVKKNLIIFIIIAVVLVFLGSYKIFFAPKKQIYSFEMAKKGNIIQEVSAIGQVKKGEEVNLGFKQTGKIDKIYVKVGEKVGDKTPLIKLDTNQLSIQLGDAMASLDLARAEYNKLLVGASAQEIQVKQTTVDNAKVAYNNAKQNLENVKRLADENLKSDYDDAMNVLEDSNLKAYNAFNVAGSVQRAYFNNGDQESILVIEKKNQVEVFKNQIKFYLDLVNASSSDGNIDLALSKTKDALSGIYDDLSIIRETCELGNYRNTVSSSDKTSLDNQKSYINTAFTNAVDTFQVISGAKTTNKSNIDSAQTSLDSAEGNLRIVQDQLILITSKPRQEDIDLYQAKVKKAEASVNLLLDQISDSTIKSPIEGQIVKINKELGEQTSIGEIIISLIPEKPFQIESDIAETDSVKIDLGNFVKITLDAFPEEEFSGKVIEIDPAETVISGVIYYKTKVSLESENEKIKPGMTASINIITGSQENTLVIPHRAVTEKDGKNLVKILDLNNNIEEREVKVGLIGSSGEIEILSGLKEGDRVITLIKSK